MNFCLFVYLRSYNGKSRISFLQTLQSSHNTSYFLMCPFCAKWYRCLALIFLYTLKKIKKLKLCNVLEEELKTYTPVGPCFQENPV